MPSHVQRFYRPGSPSELPPYAELVKFPKHGAGTGWRGLAVEPERLGSPVGIETENTHCGE